MNTALNAFKYACEKSSPFFIISKALRLVGNDLKINEHSVALNEFANIISICIGKSAILMAAAVESQLSDKLTHAYAISPVASLERQNKTLEKTQLFVAGCNNMPDKRAFEATEQILTAIKRFDRKDTLFIFCVSGGSSALFAAVEDGISHESKIDTIKLLSKNGATIQQLNTIRSQLSAVKGGKTLNMINVATVETLLISDIIGDPAHLIGSGPTIPCEKHVSHTQLVSIIEELKVENKICPEVLSLLKKKKKYAVPLCIEHHQILSSNKDFLQIVQDCLAEEGFSTYSVTSELDGNATVVGKKLATLCSAKNSDELTKRVKILFPKFNQTFAKDCTKIALLFGGETTVIVKGSGKGGRNQELSLAAILEARGSAETTNFPNFVFMSCGTDGQDGPTDAAGAYFSNSDISKIDIKVATSFLESADSYHFWNSFNDGRCHVKIGTTGTNVMDIQMLLFEF